MSQRGRTNIYIVNDDPNLNLSGSSFSSYVTLGPAVLQGHNVTITPQGIYIDGGMSPQELEQRRRQEEAERERRRLAEENRKKQRREISKFYPFLLEETQKEWNRIFPDKFSPTDDSKFFVTRAVTDMKTFLEKTYTVFVLAYPGDGKSANCKYLAKEINKGSIKYEVLYINSPQEWKERVKSDKYQMIIIEDIFGIHSVNLPKVEMWQDVLQKLQMDIYLAEGRTLLMITCGKHIYEQAQKYAKGRSLFPHLQIVDMTTDGLKMNSWERGCIARSWPRSIPYDDCCKLQKKEYTGYGLVVRLSKTFKPLKAGGRSDSIEPLNCLLGELDKVSRVDPLLYGLLAFVALQGKPVKFSYDEIDHFPHVDLLRLILKALSVDIENLTTWMLKEAAQFMTGVFFEEDDNGGYYFVHQRMREYALISFAQNHDSIVIEHANEETFLELISTIFFYQSQYHKVVTTSVTNLDYLSRRVVFEILQGHLRLVCQHHLFSDEKFVKSFMEYLEKLGNREDVLRTRDEDNKSLMFWAAWYGHDHILQDLIKNDTLWEEADDDQKSFAFLFSCYRGCTKSLKAFMDRDIDVTTIPEVDTEDLEKLVGYEFMYYWNAGCYPLHFATIGGSSLNVTELLNHGADPKVVNKYGETPMHLAACFGNREICRQLDEKGADAKAMTPLGKKPLHNAVLYGNTSSADFLVRKGVEPKEVCDDGRPYLHVAVANGDLKMVEQLAGMQGINKNAYFRFSWKCIHEAVFLGDSRIADYLLKEGLENFSMTMSSHTPLHWALENDDKDMIALLMEQGMFLNDSAIKDSVKPIHIAAKKGLTEIAKDLIAMGIDPDVRDADGNTPASLADENIHFSLCSYIKDHIKQKQKRVNRRFMPMFGPYGMPFEMMRMKRF